MKGDIKVYLFFAVVLFIIFSIYNDQLVFAQTKTKFGDSLQKADVEGVREALKKGANPNERYDGKGSSALYRAVFPLGDSYGVVSEELENKIIAVLEALFESGAKLQYYDNWILYLPVERGAKKVTKYLLDRGANPNGDDPSFTPLILAIESDHDEIAKLLLDYGAKPIDTKTATQVRFIGASKRGDLIALKRELTKGANVNGKNPYGETALVEAAHWGHFMVVKELLRLGAAPNLPGKGLFGEGTPLHYAVGRGCLIRREGCSEIVKLLLKSGAHVSSTNSYKKQTPLHIAAMFNNEIAARILLDAGAKVMPKDEEGKTPLDYAESAEMIKLLKSYGAKENP